MEEFVAYLVKNLVSSPEAVSVISSVNDGKIVLEIHVSKADAGKVIGRHGNTINALRTITQTVAARFGKKIHLELVQPDGTRVAKSQCEESEVASVCCAD